MGTVISIANQKGGVGKTTTAINLSAALCQHNKKVLLIDMDPQSNATSGIGINKSLILKSMHQILLTNMHIDEVVLNTTIENLHIIPATFELAGVDLELSNCPDKQFKLKYKVDLVKNKYDYIIIDCPPSLGLLSINAFVASDSILIPVQCEYFAMEGLAQLLATYRVVKLSLNENLSIEGIILTMYDKRIKLTHEVANELGKFFNEKYYKTVIPRNIKLAEAASIGKSIFEYDKRSKGAKAYLDISKELIRNEFKKK